MDMTEFFTIVQEMRNWLIEESNRGFSQSSIQRLTTKQLFITNITKGSVNCLSTISVGDESLVRTVAKRIETGFKSNTRIGSILATSYSVDDNILVAQTVSSSPSNLGLILGLAIPLGVLFLVASIAAICFKVRSNKKSGKSSENGGNH